MVILFIFLLTLSLPESLILILGFPCLRFYMRLSLTLVSIFGLGTPPSSGKSGRMRGSLKIMPFALMLKISL